MLNFIGNNSSSGGLVGALIRLVLRFFQFVLGITVCGLYGVDLNNAHKAGVGADGKWVFAEVVGALSVFTVLIYGIPFVKSYWAFGWDWVLFILWTALFGLFGRIYIPSHPTPHQSGQMRMKNAVWVDLVNMLLWLITAIYSTVIFVRAKAGRTMHTGRATV
ncbi:Hypothetical protein R9X50_00785100 [Acrodontium crateriforme]|uniref:MARVEL domain-containing protein n=1 Tax=Acrodontium crateriforme TaxID=150365 RepID=A0AAQ3MAU4_9PEZI|nr:Hypothetical protein R9X50_00785100 [Acrodontium crateriforme]